MRVLFGMSGTVQGATAVQKGETDVLPGRRGQQGRKGHRGGAGVHASARPRTGAASLVTAEWRSCDSSDHGHAWVAGDSIGSEQTSFP
nr:hypothetical protein StreXyl84_09530 [Streptomyces sp. Xyl84]